MSDTLPANPLHCKILVTPMDPSTRGVAQRQHDGRYSAAYQWCTHVEVRSINQTHWADPAMKPTSIGRIHRASARYGKQ